MIKVTLIRPKGCSHCEDIDIALEKLKQDYRLVTEEVEATSEKGQELILKHGIFTSPGILMNDEFFAMGGATADQLRKKFEQLSQSTGEKA